MVFYRDGMDGCYVVLYLHYANGHPTKTFLLIQLYNQNLCCTKILKYIYKSSGLYGHTSCIHTYISSYNHDIHVTNYLEWKIWKILFIKVWLASGNSVICIIIENMLDTCLVICIPYTV